MARAGILFLTLLCIILVESLPTMYKVNENRKLEADLVPVSSTVIPLPVYKVGYGLQVPSVKAEKGAKPEGPIHLITVHTKKKALPPEKPSSVKELSKKQFTN